MWRYVAIAALLLFDAGAYMAWKKEHDQNKQMRAIISSAWREAQAEVT